MVELRIKIEPGMDGNKTTSNNSSNAHHLQNHSSINSNLGATSTFLSSTNYKDNSILNSSGGRCCSNLNCSRSQKENCPQGVYERKQAAAKRLLKAVQSNDFEHLKYLLESKPDLNVMVNGQTVLHHTILLGRDVNWAKQLVNCGANPNLSNNDGWNSLHLAAFNGLPDTLSYLIKQQCSY